MSELSTLAYLTIRRGAGELGMVDLTRDGVVSVNVEVGHAGTGEQADIFLECEDVLAIREWCDQVLKANNK